MQVKKSEFEQLAKRDLVIVKSATNNEGVTIIWYDNPPAPQEQLKLEKCYSWQGNSYTLQVIQREQRKVIATATIIRPSANKYKVTFYKDDIASNEVIIEMSTFAKYDEIINYLKEQSKNIKQ